MFRVKNPTPSEHYNHDTYNILQGAPQTDSCNGDKICSLWLGWLYNKYNNERGYDKPRPNLYKEKYNSKILQLLALWGGGVLPNS